MIGLCRFSTKHLHSREHIHSTMTGDIGMQIDECSLYRVLQARVITPEFSSQRQTHCVTYGHSRIHVLTSKYVHIHVVVRLWCFASDFYFSYLDKITYVLRSQPSLYLKFASGSLVRVRILYSSFTKKRSLSYVACHAIILILPLQRLGST